jgi:hypothetical protein
MKIKIHIQIMQIWVVYNNLSNGMELQMTYNIINNSMI